MSPVAAEPTVATGMAVAAEPTMTTGMAVAAGVGADVPVVAVVVARTAAIVARRAVGDTGGRPFPAGGRRRAAARSRPSGAVPAPQAQQDATDPQQHRSPKGDRDRAPLVHLRPPQVGPPAVPDRRWHGHPRPDLRLRA